MTVAVYLPLLLAPLLALTARRLSTRGAPSPAARGLAVAAVVAAACSTWSLCLLALTLLDDLPPLAALDNHPGIELPEPVPGPVALLAALALAWGLVRLLGDLRRRFDTHRQLRAVATPHAGFVVADWAAPLAVAVPGRPGHLLVTTGMLRLLDDSERRAVFAHEHAHLAHRHHRIVAWTAAAAALNPLLAGVREAVEFLVERWADEDAAATVDDRTLVARAVARAALATTGSGSARVLGIHGGVAVHRVRALTEPAPPAQRRRLLGPLLLSGAFLATSAVATVEFVALARAWL
ncbi:M48 family metalloprotease [Micromonospora sp. NPDC092111]|uniref:M48 family metalloprotease n=1 Tax=Micromonospora sp. NPDC092111 TaxID=3364289 RepID=UPI00380F8E5C